MRKLKYIRVKSDLADSVFMFPVWDTHSDVAHKLGYPVVSAGFVTVKVTSDGEFDVTTHGRSESLNLESDPADAELIKFMLK